jgi:hypothetical protein
VCVLLCTSHVTLVLYFIFYSPVVVVYSTFEWQSKKTAQFLSSYYFFLFFSFWDIFTRSENLYNLTQKYNSMMSLIIFVVLDNRWMMAFARRCATSSTRIRFRYSASLFKGSNLLFDISRERERSDESSLNCVKKNESALAAAASISYIHVAIMWFYLALFLYISVFIIKAREYFYQRDLYYAGLYTSDSDWSFY